MLEDPGDLRTRSARPGRLADSRHDFVSRKSLHITWRQLHRGGYTLPEIAALANVDLEAVAEAVGMDVAIADLYLRSEWPCSRIAASLAVPLTDVMRALGGRTRKHPKIEYDLPDEDDLVAEDQMDALCKSAPPDPGDVARQRLLERLDAEDAAAEAAQAATVALPATDAPISAPSGPDAPTAIVGDPVADGGPSSPAAPAA